MERGSPTTKAGSGRGVGLCGVSFLMGNKSRLTVYRRVEVSFFVLFLFSSGYIETSLFIGESNSLFCDLCWVGLLV